MQSNSLSYLALFSCVKIQRESMFIALVHLQIIVKQQLITTQAKQFYKFYKSISMHRFDVIGLIASIDLSVSLLILNRSFFYFIYLSIIYLFKDRQLSMPGYDEAFWCKKKRKTKKLINLQYIELRCYFSSAFVPRLKKVSFIIKLCDTCTVEHMIVSSSILNDLPYKGVRSVSVDWILPGSDKVF